jgi:hypothetical protein
MRYSSRFFLFAPVCVFLALMAVVSVHWWIVANALSARLAAANGHEITPGVVMRFASRRISGFPFSLDTVFRDVSFEIATPHGPAVWRSENFAMHALTYGRDETIFEAAGKQEFDWMRNGVKRSRPFAVGSLHASAISDKSGLARIDVDLVGFGSPGFTAQRLQFHARRDADDRLDVAVFADGMRSPANADPIESLASLHFEGTMDEAHAFDAALAGSERWYEALDHWREARGTLHVAAASYELCGMKLTGHGDTRLDVSHRLIGLLNSKIIAQSKIEAKHCPPHPIFLDTMESLDTPSIELWLLGPLY